LPIPSPWLGLLESSKPEGLADPQSEPGIWGIQKKDTSISLKRENDVIMMDSPMDLRRWPIFGPNPATSRKSFLDGELFYWIAG